MFSKMFHFFIEKKEIRANYFLILIEKIRGSRSRRKHLKLPNHRFPYPLDFENQQKKIFYEKEGTKFSVPTLKLEILLIFVSRD